ncbi:MAG: hypothetical protein QNJ13_08750 [Paracoccaceae bacterium]|nr:hypothetical protein [Paracoccaceae bacterium]
MRSEDVVENYTNAFLWSFGVLVFMALFGIWVVWGLLGAALTGAIADRLITKDFRRRGR